MTPVWPRQSTNLAEALADPAGVVRLSVLGTPLPALPLWESIPVVQRCGISGPKSAEVVTDRRCHRCQLQPISDIRAHKFVAPRRPFALAPSRQSGTFRLLALSQAEC